MRSGGPHLPSPGTVKNRRTVLKYNDHEAPEGRGADGTCSAAVARPLHLPGCTGASSLCDQMNGVDAPAAPDAAVQALRTCTATTDPPGTQLQTAEHVDTPDTVVMTPPPAPSVPEAPETTMTRSAFNGKGTATATATSHGQNTKAALRVQQQLEADSEIEARAAALVAAVRAGQILPSVRPARALVSEASPPRKAQKVSRQFGTRSPVTSPAYDCAAPLPGAHVLLHVQHSPHATGNADLLASSPRLVGRQCDGGSCGGEIRDDQGVRDTIEGPFWGALLDDADDVFDSVEHSASGGFLEADWSIGAV